MRSRAAIFAALTLALSGLPVTAAAAGGYIKGALVASGTGLPVAAIVSISPCPGGVVPGCSLTNSAADGSFAFNNLPDGTYTVSYAMSDAIAVAPGPDSVTVLNGSPSPPNLYHVVQFSNTVQMDGYIKDNHGGPIASQTFALHDLSGQAVTDISATSDALGHYVIHPAKNTNYSIVMKNRNYLEVHAPAIYDLATDSNSPLVIGTLDLHGLDLVLPEVHITVCVQGPGGVAVANALVATDQSQTLGLSLARLPASGSDWYDSVGFPTTGSDGCASLWLFPNLAQHILTVTPQASSGLATTSLPVPVTASSDGAMVSVSVGRSADFTGTLLDGLGRGVPAQLVMVQSSVASTAPWISSSPTTNNGGFRIPGLVLNGTYNLRVVSPPIPGASFAGPDTYLLRTDPAHPVAVTTTPLTVSLPVVRVPITVTGNAGAFGLAGYQVTAPDSVPVNGLSLAGQPAFGSDSVSSPTWAVTDSSGQTSLWLFPSTSPYSINAAPPSGSRQCSAPVPITVSVAAAGSASAAFQLSCAVNVAGVVLDGAGNPVGGQTVTLSGPAGATVSTLSSPDGSYALQVPGPGTYSITLAGTGGATAALPPSYSVPLGTQVLSSDLSNLTVRAPFVPLTVTVTNKATGAALSGAILNLPSASGPAGSFAYSSAPVTGADGLATLWLLPGSYSVRARSGPLLGTATAAVPAVNAVTVQVAPDDGLAPSVVWSFVPSLPPPLTVHNGWYTSPFTVHWTVTDDTALSYSCPDVLINQNTTGRVESCTATDSAGNQTTASTPLIKFESTGPDLVWTAPPAGGYTVDQTISPALTCTATDLVSGVENPDCGTVGGPAYTYALGSNTVWGSATNRAGLIGKASITFTVSVTRGSLCALVHQFETEAGIANALCVKLGVRGVGTGNDHLQLNAFNQQVQAQRGKTLTASQADILIRLAGSL